MTTATYFTKSIDLTPEQTPDELKEGRSGTPVLRVELYYSKDARKRGLKLSVNRVVVSPNSTSGFPMSAYNGLLHLATLDRKNDKIGKEWASRVEAAFPKLAEVALASESPDWQAVFSAINETAPEPAAA